MASHSVLYCMGFVESNLLSTSRSVVLYNRWRSLSGDQPNLAWSTLQIQQETKK
jgi:hypothetical protein